MPPPLILDTSEIDLTKAVISREAIYEALPHRHEFMLLDGMCYLADDSTEAVALVHVREDAWWCRGHVPGRVILPGVLMLEMAAQSTAYLAYSRLRSKQFIAFGGIDNCKFRDAVIPPADLHILCVVDELRSRRIRAYTQGVCDGRLIFEARVTGQFMPSRT